VTAAWPATTSATSSSLHTSSITCFDFSFNTHFLYAAQSLIRQEAGDSKAKPAT
jgi:hypothetical protein